MERKKKILDRVEKERKKERENDIRNKDEEVREKGSE